MSRTKRIQRSVELKKLEERGALENTYVIYTAELGMASGRHVLQGKQILYVHTWRVPYIVSGPGIEGGRRAQGNIYLLDTLSTICELAGVEVPSTNEGISFAPVLFGEEETVRETLYGVYCGGTKPGMRSVRHGDWKLIKYDVLAGAVRETQLFNLAENPYEFLPEHGKEDAMLTNLAEDPAHAEKRKELEALLLSEMERLHDPYRFWDQEK